MEKFFKKLWRNRPFRTFIQGFFGVLTGNCLFGLSIDEYKAILLSAIMAGISAVMSLNTGEE